MSDPLDNPLWRDPSIVIAREALARDGVGQWLSVYAVARLKAPHPDPLTFFGLPLLDLVHETVEDRPASMVTAARAKSGDFEHWSVILAFKGGVRASIDIGAGIGVAQSAPLDLRIEWKGTERVIVAEPTAVAVAVTTARGVSERSAEVTPLLDELSEFDPNEFSRFAPYLTAILTGARRSAETGVPIALTR